MSTERRTEHGPSLDGGREGPGEAMTLPGAGGAPGGGAAGADQSAEPVWRYQVPPPGSGNGIPADESNAGHYTPNAAGHGGGIVGAPAESNVNAPGQPLSGAGSATDPAGGTIGGIQASRKAQETGAAAGGGIAGESAANADGNMSGSAGSD